MVAKAGFEPTTFATGLFYGGYSCPATPPATVGYGQGRGTTRLSAGGRIHAELQRCHAGPHAPESIWAEGLRSDSGGRNRQDASGAWPGLDRRTWWANDCTAWRTAGMGAGCSSGTADPTPERKLKRYC
jgi:hypothetical protein